MPRTPEQYEAMRAATRDKIQNAAISLFTRKGFAATSVQDIARAAGISTGLMYRHYRTKDDLFGALIDQAADGLDAVIESFRSDRSAPELINAFVREFLGDIAAGGASLEFYLLMHQAVLFDSTDPRIVRLLDRQEDLTRATARLIRRGQRDGSFRPGRPAALADLLFAAIGGLTVMRFTRGDRFSTPKPEQVTAFLIKDLT